GVPSSLVLRDLRIGAKRAGKGDAMRRVIIEKLGRYDLVRRYALFDPAIDSGDEVVIRILRVTRVVGPVEYIRARPGKAMTHTRRHEEAEEILRLLQRRAVPAVVLLAPLRGDDGIVVL